MQLRITSPDSVIFEWEIQEITLPTEMGELKVLPWNKPMVTAIKPGIVTFLSWNKKTALSVWKWMVFVDGKIVRIATSSATTWSTDKAELKKKKEELEAKLKKLTLNGSLEDIEKLQNQLAKIEADIKLSS